MIASLAIGMCANAVAATPEDKAFTSPKGTFQFAYSELIMCARQDPSASNSSYPWEPVDCWDWAQGCGQESSPKKTTVCLAFPKADLKHYLKVTGGTIAVAEVTDKASEHACLDLAEYLFEGIATVKVQIGELTFAHVERGYAGGGHADFHSIYRAFHNGVCYQIEMTVDTVSGDFEMTPAETKSFNAEADTKVRNRLRRVIDTFRFLK